MCSSILSGGCTNLVFVPPSETSPASDWSVPIMAAPVMFERPFDPETRMVSRGKAPRGQGLTGGPAIGGGASIMLFAINAAGLAKDVAFITDGQLSGLCLKGRTIAEVAPEGAVGRGRDGDRIDVAARRIDVLVPVEELARRPGPPNAVPVPADGWLGIYRRDVHPMATGAVLTDMG
ncbi:MAG: dihydroxy-acid dehydratase [Sphingobium sp.]|nr:dihydroxy-acid dehydratase [Sphingobium sp.]